MSDSLPDYDVLTDALRRLEADSDAAECHGGLCGMLCTVEQLDMDYWLNISLPAASQFNEMSEVRILLHDLFETTRTQMASEAFAFQLVLPDDEASLLSRVESLANWSQGFLVGLSYGGMTNTAQLPGDLPEIVQDLLEISRAESFDIEEEADEAAYTELVEYVRMSVLLFREELREFATAAATNAGDEKPLH